VLHGLAVGASPQRLLGGGLEIPHRLDVIAAVQEPGRELGHVLVDGRPVGPLEPDGDGPMHPRPAAGRDPLVEHRPVEIVQEREPGRHGTVGPLDRVERPEEAALAGEHGAAPLDLLGGPGPTGGRRRGGEFDAVDGGRLQHPEVGGVEPLQLQLDHATDVLGEPGIGGVGLRQRPAPRLLPQDARVGPGLDQLGHEQRYAVGLSVHQPNQLLRQLGPVEPAFQDPPNGGAVEFAEPDLVHGSPAQEVRAGVADRMAGRPGVGRPVGADHQQPGPGVPPGQPLHQVDGGGVGPVQVLEDKDERALRAGRFQRLGHLPQHPRPCAPQCPPLEHGQVVGTGQRGHLGQPRRGEAGQEGHQRLAVVAAQAGQGIEDREVRLGGPPVLQALATGNGEPFDPPDPFRERVDDRGLADARLPGHEHQLALAAGGEVEQGGEPLQLRLAADRRGRGGQARRSLALLEDRLDEPVAAAVDGSDHALLAAAVADRPPGRLQPAGQRRVGHEPAAPDLVQQLGLGHDPVPVPDQVGQDLEDLRLQVAGRSAAAQLIAPLVELAVTEPVDHPDRLHVSSTSSPSFDVAASRA
jgi:hypothetical protein